ncbi:hypothetical protein POK33_38705 [Burkholderia cenocepacia]|uniref:hypothetical protein n=1 Tax=Burkholderia cenocepacia TaxID=95486 RepID=UPI0023B98BD0|nr:hypothetical protein [Burkholderia cenocepacia]MDF0506685.1 hypothetical protein [Burkholderia cenocepacia]
MDIEWMGERHCHAGSLPGGQRVCNTEVCCAVRIGCSRPSSHPPHLRVVSLAKNRDHPIFREPALLPAFLSLRGSHSLWFPLIQKIQANRKLVRMSARAATKNEIDALDDRIDALKGSPRAPGPSSKKMLSCG